MLIGLHHYDQDIKIFPFVNWVVSGEADQSALKILAKHYL